MKRAIVLALIVSLGGCVAPPSVSLEMEESAVEVRSYQSRDFEGVPLATVMQALMGTLQDLGFVIRNGDGRLGLVSATRYEGVQELIVTATARQDANGVVNVRVNARLGVQPVVDPEPYRDFFAAVTQAVFLEHGSVPAKTGT